MLKLRDGFWQGVTWSRPDSPTPALCSRCSGALPEVPLMFWRENKSAASFCDACIEAWVVTESAAMSCYQCPASMCPLIAKDGSPWNDYAYGVECPGTNACFWWEFTCNTGGIQALVEEAERNGGRPVFPLLGPNKPHRYVIGEPREYDCPKAHVCRWQERAEKDGLDLCPPRDALSRGLDPRVCIY